MPSRPQAHLMLPSPMGLLEYDVLEDGVFLGPGTRGGLQAGPRPFPGAAVALTRTEAGFVARALPGEPEPQVNGEATGDRPLADGDRLRVAEHIVLFRTQRGPLRAAPAAPAPRAASPPPPTRSPPPPRRNPAVRILALGGLAILLAALVSAVRHLKAIQAARMSGAELPEIEQGEAPGPSRACQELEEIRDLERRGDPRIADLIARYAAFQDRHEDTPEAEAARDRVRELTAAWSEQSRKELDAQVEKLIGAHQFARALGEVRAFEARFGTTPAAEGLGALRRRVRSRARASLDALIAKVGPLITPQPREAHRMLIGVHHEFPPDMAVEVVSLLERAVTRMMALEADRRRPRHPPPEPPSELPPFPKGPDPVPPPEGGERPRPVPPGEDAARDRMARDAWAAARADLLRGSYAEALQGYTMLMQQFGNTAYYRAHKKKIQAGRYAAKVGVRGPAGLLAADAETRKGRLEVEYQFNDMRVFEEDWTQEQPFSSDRPVAVSWRGGAVEMAQASGLLHKLVFLSDVRLEATVLVQQPHDFGLMAVQESDDFRAILFDVANTQFKLKKGAAARVNPGHVLWYIGQGVWADADKDAHGFIKIAERSVVKLEGGDRLKMELIRRKNVCEGSFQGKTDGVHLQGKVRGDDGSTMGSGRVGLFTNSGIVTVQSARISGVVDMDWFRRQLEFLVSADPGPEEGG